MSGSLRRWVGPVALVALIGLAACGGSTGPSPTASAVASTRPTSTATSIPSPTRAPVFVVTGGMTDERIDAAATLLADGKVLIAGGSPAPVDLAGAYALASAELYDPATGRFTPTGSMVWGRVGASATLLSDGRVLIAGGYGCPATKCSEDTFNNDITASAELYDPATGKFTATGSMSDARFDASAVSLPDGRVLILNGGTQVAELYDPASGKFARIGSLLNYYGSNISALPLGHGTGTATLLANGNVLAVGAVDDGYGAELFDPASGKSTSIPLTLPKDHGAQDQIPQTANLLKDGRVLVFVWSSPNYMYPDPPYSELAILVTYDPEANAFGEPAWIASPSRWLLPKATSLPDGRVLFTGGMVGPDSRDDYHETDTGALYDPVTGFHLIGAMTQPRAGQTATLLPDGSVLIAGGIGGEVASTAELLKP